MGADIIKKSIHNLTGILIPQKTIISRSELVNERDVHKSKTKVYLYYLYNSIK